MRRAQLVDIHLRFGYAPGQRANNPGMVQVNMRSQDVRDILWIKGCRAYSIEQRFQCAARSRIDEQEFVVSCQQIGTNYFILVLEWQRNLPESSAKLLYLC